MTNVQIHDITQQELHQNHNLYQVFCHHRLYQELMYHLLYPYEYYIL
jgi:hypothetical protein